MGRRIWMRRMVFENGFGSKLITTHGQIVDTL